MPERPLKAAALLVCLALAGCCPPKYLYASAPANLIPRPPELPKIESAALQCLSDDTYTRLAERDRALRQNNAELRALLGDSSR